MRRVRKDPPGGDWDALVASIREQVFTLPEGTRILSGHGAETKVGEETRGESLCGRVKEMACREQAIVGSWQMYLCQVIGTSHGGSRGGLAKP